MGGCLPCGHASPTPSTRHGLKSPPTVATLVSEAIRGTVGGSSEALSMSRLLLNYDPARAFDKHYSRGSKIGAGGFGIVYRCRRHLTRVERAVKTIAKTKVKEDMHFVLTEIEAMLRLDHPNIVKFFEFFEQPGEILVVTELCTGGDFAALHGGRTALETLRPLFRDVLLGVAYCHDLQIVHRDLKFENCLLCLGPSRTMAKVIDFGLSAIRREADPVERRRSIPGASGDAWLKEALGTKYFAAPEVIDQDSRYGVKCDLWSVGVMLYILCANEHPFAKNAAKLDTKALFKLVVSGSYREEPLRKAKVEDAAQALMRGLMVREPARRLSAVEALQMAWLRPSSSRELDIKKAVSKGNSDAMYRRLSSWTETSHFDKAVLMLVAHQAKVQEVEQMRAAFLALDKNGDGSLSKEELATGLKSVGHTLPKSRFEDVFRWLDSNENERVDYCEWLCATMEPHLIDTDNSIQELFEFFDSDASGFVSVEELTRVISKEEAQLVVEENDTSKDGLIDLREFKAFMLRLARLRGAEE
eukprot:CAMPEP_0168452130 /NCGR_PEP_ID=MMETSP0228-20121227/48989_1 /TAXON_ID=133427 /ORGANISM="Protoceratium reticulatum, Strain CCCM 535 (=CCMP 1889)" /LENGTH=529 /DNA_ID=CAMNT_0008466761 /DNA_START=1 /DNA_END=1588 /DNA_ORIENTATION=-